MATTKRTYENEIKMTKKPIAGISLYQDGEKEREPSAEKIYDKIEITQAQQLRGKQMDSLIKGETPTEAAQRSPKRYLVDPTTGVITVDEEEGELSYKDAILSSASVMGALRAQRGDSDGAVEIFKTAVEIVNNNRTPGATAEKIREFYIDDDTGVIIHDPENGELTLSEARAMAQSRQRALAPRGEESITREGLELLKRDLRDELRALIAGGNQESPFQFNEEGKPVLNPGAKGLSISDVLAYQFMTKEQQPGPGAGGLYKDAQGNIMSLPDALELKKFENEEVRKDKRVDSLQGIIADARKQLPLIAEGIQEALVSRARGASREGAFEGEEPREEVHQEVRQEQEGGEVFQHPSVEI